MTDDEKILYRKWKRMNENGKLFESIRFNTEKKMKECHQKLKKDESRKAFTMVFHYGEQIIGYEVFYLPNWRKVKIEVI